MSVLTIGMIVKNESVNLPLCLEKLAPLREAIDCTLVITDTGSTDGTAELAKASADRFYTYEWNDDFSSARNTTLQNLDSQWYMYIDADEHCADCAPLIAFFKSGAYKQYDSAIIIIHNVLSANTSNEFRANRLVKAVPGMHFSGLIHEYIDLPVSNPFNINAVFMHNGYAPEVLSRKELRNMTLLEKELTTVTDINLKLNTLFQLGETCYRFSPEDAVAHWEKGFVLSNEPGAEKLYKYCFLARLEMFYYHSNDFDNAVSVHERYAALRKSARDFSRDDIYTDLEDAYFCGLTFAKTEDFEAAYTSLKKYNALLERYRADGGLSFAEDNRFYPAASVSPESAAAAEKAFVGACIKTQRFSEAQKILLSSGGDLRDLLLCMDGLGDYSKLSGYSVQNGDFTVIFDFLLEAKLPLELAIAADNLYKNTQNYRGDFGGVARYLSGNFNPSAENLHTELAVIKYLTSFQNEPKEIKTLQQITENYISRVYLIRDPKHYNPLINAALDVIKTHSL
jgi:glycosyltransferase involved in cell wall biosynthesis